MSGEGESEPVENLATNPQNPWRNGVMGITILIVVFVVLLIALFFVRGGRRRGA
jgi:hypothetical protein